MKTSSRKLLPRAIIRDQASGKIIFAGENAMKFSKEKEMLDALVGIVNVTGDQVTVVNEAGLPAIMDDLVYTAVFGDGLVRDTARWLIWHIAQAVDIFPASIHEIYMAVGHGHLPANFTVPAVNVRAANYYTSRAVFRAANSQDVGTFIFEIARSEMGYTDQRPAEYVSCILGAAIREGFRGRCPRELLAPLTCGRTHSDDGRLVVEE